MKLQSCTLLAMLVTIEAQLIPPQEISFSMTPSPVNGSSATGHCNEIIDSSTYRCLDPTSSVVYDGIIPTLTGLDGNMWASQLLTTNVTNTWSFIFDTTPNFTAVKRVEIVMFNCPQWRISAQSVQVAYSSSPIVTRTANISISSCDSLVRVCIGDLFVNSTLTSLSFIADLSNWAHIAEVEFYDDSPICPEETIITAAPTTPTTSPTSDPDDMMSIAQCTATISLASVVTAITTALLATLIFVLLQIALCKYHPKFKRGKSEPAATARGEELAMYEQVDESEEGVVGSDPTYMEVEASEDEEQTIDMKKNKAYATTSGQLDRGEGGEENPASNSAYLEIVKDRDSMDLSENKAYGARTGQEEGVTVSAHLEEGKKVNMKTNEAYQTFTKVDEGKGGVAASAPTYMEVGANEKKTVDLKKNKAYGITNVH